MSTRTIKLKLLTQVSLVSIETGVRTLGEFKELPEVQALDIKWPQSKLIDRATKNSIDLDDAVLPAIDCIIFVTPTKTESGAFSRKELYASIKKLKENGVTIPFNNYTQVSNEELVEFISRNTPMIPNPNFENAEVKPFSPNYITREVIQRVIILEETPVEEDLIDEDKVEERVYSGLADFITKSELEDEELSVIPEFIFRNGIKLVLDKSTKTYK